MSKYDEHFKLDATPEQVAQAIFAGARAPDPTKRKPRKNKRKEVIRSPGPREPVSTKEG